MPFCTEELTRFPASPPKFHIIIRRLFYSLYRFHLHKVLSSEHISSETKVPMIKNATDWQREK